MIKLRSGCPNQGLGGRRGWLVLLAGAVRHKKPDKIVFVGKGREYGPPISG